MNKFLAGHPFDKTKVTLRVSGEDLDPGRVERLLSRKGTTQVKLGERYGRSGRIAKCGMWRLESDCQPDAPLGDHIRRILELITEERTPWTLELAGYQKDVFVGGWIRHWNTVFQVEGELLFELGSRGIGLCFDLYVNDDVDSEVEDRETLT